ncbi:putative ATP/GTP-binding protein (plasmid) [Streptomyces sp. GBA 94-10 4N24]|uniref:ATP-binding protein n=1 Tax=Streptomyces sp. GBA 94-10 4N24 TaxID=1218177 RepID=UPI0003C2D767|nr:ATP-binding protein [Streptomyces sp. GBA 94-10 4N24]ESP95615.1 putative ATP/GTP-binding protein [Streptomyces sp. GBA 94-10 4N24]UZN63077.1 putative ATP/GTP-binding protein [Streptomyces sp. GBA 94-10 4N24]
MRVPVRHLAGNVIWTLHGTVWAIWRIEGSAQVNASRRAKKERLATVETLVKQLRGESMLLSLCPQINPATVVEKMTAAVDLAASPRYEELAHTMLDQLEQVELTGRTDWLAVQLPTSRRQALGEALRAARAEVALELGLLPAPVTAQQERERLAQAADLASAWPSGIARRPATEAEIMWIYGHSARRGVIEPLLPHDAPKARGRGRGMAGLGQAVLAEGGLPEQRKSRPARPRLGRRWLEATTEWGTSYQCLLGLSQMPKEFVFPGSEFLARVDQFPYPVDWAVRLSVESGADAEPKSRRQAEELAGQYSEYEGEPSGPPSGVDEANEGIHEYRGRLTSSASEVEVRAMTALCVWGDTPQEAERRAKDLAGYFGGHEYVFDRPRGEMENLWHGMLPGARTPRVMTGYAQYLLARDFSMSGPFTGAELGDASGPLYGLQLAGGGARPVYTDFSRAPREHASGSAAYVGELGAGKSVALKAAVHAILAAGRRRGVRGSRGRAVIVDRTPKQEWVRFAQACPGETQVITIDTTAAVSLDPLRIFEEKREAQRFTESFLTLLLGISPMDDEGIALSEAVAYVLAEPNPSMRVLTEELANRGSGDPAAKRVARRLAAVARKDLAATLFDETLPVVRTSEADSVVFSVASLALPKKRELESARLDRLEFEKTFGRSVMYLIAALCRKIAFARDEEFTAVVWDECWWLTSSPEGCELLLEVVRDGRKHNAGALVGSHDPQDIGPADSEVGQVILGLIPRRFLFRHTDIDLARRGLQFLGCDPHDDELLQIVTQELSPITVSDEDKAARAGECLHRDLMGRIGGMQILIPPDPEAAAHIHSQPIAIAA